MSTEAAAVLGAKFKQHVSSFAQARFIPAATLSTSSMSAAASAAHGAAWFVVVVQLVVAATITAKQKWGADGLGSERFLWFAAVSALFNCVYWRSWGSDPGVVTQTAEVSRQAPPQLPAVEVALNSFAAVRPRRLSPADPEAWPPADADSVPLRYCEVCDLRQPLRSKHCDKCGVCIRKYDHHCFWVGGCVGEYNHGRFFCVLLCGTLYVFVATFLALSCVSVRGYATWREVVWANAAPVVLAVTGAFMFLFVGGLLVFHAVMIATNQTTWEAASGSRITYLAGVRSGHNPFDRGFVRNLSDVFCAPRRPMEWRMSPSSIKGGQTVV